ncbi:MAG: hypothetical protein LQ348_000329 [Seirophora lacunosa]|nr:MAG: hypothetical protein LQ348_000329 [Seirophora lacunosa]
MVESDEEYAPGASDDDVEAHQVTASGRNVTSRIRRAGPVDDGFNTIRRTWEDVEEGEDGTITGTIDSLLQQGKRKRTLKDTTPLQRGIIRHLLLIIDLSTAMIEKDLRPTRYLLTIRYCQDFVNEFFEQNPISQIGIIGMRDGLAIRVSDMSGNPSDHISNLQALRKEDPKGQPSLQNALDMARAALFHAPSHGTREILLLFGSLLSSDPGDIHTTISSLVNSHITTTVIGLSAQVAICLTLVKRTNPHSNPQKHYNVALDEVNYRELIMRLATPPESHSQQAATAANDSNKSSLLMMGFPSRVTDPKPSLCACGALNGTSKRVDIARLPTKPAFSDARNAESASTEPSQAALLGSKQGGNAPRQRRTDDSTVSESGRYECGTCGQFFCVDCDVFCHEIVHNCPGCLSREGERQVGDENDGHDGVTAMMLDDRTTNGEKG